MNENDPSPNAPRPFRRPSSPGQPFQDGAIALPPSPTDQARMKDQIPWRALFPLMLYRLATSARYVVVFPFITELVTSMDVPRNRIGLYSGLGEGTLMIVEAIVSPIWARLSDRYGRRPILIWASLACAPPVVMVGFSNKVWQIILFRGLAGMAPYGVIGRTMLSELSTPTTRARIFSAFAPAFAMGVMLGSTMGGELSHPYKRLPWWLGGSIELFRAWPYALPCIGAGAMIVLATIAGLIFLPETRSPRIQLPISDDESGSSRDEEPDRSLAATWRVPNFALVTSIYMGFLLSTGLSNGLEGRALTIVTMSWEAIFTVYAYTSIPRGGLGLAVDQIGIVLTLSSFFYLFAGPTLLPPTIKYFGQYKALLYVLCLWPVLAFLIPVTQFFARTVEALMWVGIALQQVLQNLGSFSFPICEMLTVTVFDDHPALLAQGTAITIVAASVGRAVGPAVSGWTYSMSTQYPEGSFGRQMAWLLLLAMTGPCIYLAWRLCERAEKGLYTYEAVSNGHTRTGDGAEQEE